MEQEKPMVCTDKDFDRFYVALKLNLKTNRYECIYSHNQEVFEIARKTEDYDTFIQIYIERFIHDADKSKLRDFLLSDKLTENLVHGYAEQDIVYRRIESEKSYIKMRAKKYVDIKDNIAMITLHNVKRTYRSGMEMKRELQKNERDKTKQYWNMVSLLSTVLDHNNLSEAENQDNIIFFTKQMYLQLQKNYPEYGITDEEVEAEINKVRESNARMLDIDDRATQDGDTVLVDFDGYVDGKQFEGGKADDYSLVLGSHSFIDNFEEQLVGKNIGDDVEVNVTFPENYQAEELQGKPAVFKVKIKEIKVKELPELDDDFAQDVSNFDTIAEYKEDLKKKLTENKEEALKREREEAVIGKIIENAQMDIPEQMVDAQTRQMTQEFAQRLSSKGLSIEIGRAHV